MAAQKNVRMESEHNMDKKHLDKLAVVFPGMGYHSDKPLLYYSKKLAKEQGYEIIEVRYDFNVRAKDIMKDKEAKEGAFSYAAAEAHKQLSSIDYKAYKNVIFIGKSIGTAVAAYYDKQNGINARHIVFTPVPETFKYLREDSGIVFHGTADPWCETELVEEKCSEFDLVLFTVADANHSLETGDSIEDSSRMPEILQEVRKMI
jgi:phosphoglycolate phosphatase